MQSSQEKYLILVSSYTHGPFAKEVQGQGVTSLVFDPLLKKIEVKNTFNEVPNISFLTFTPSGQRVLGVSEMDEGELHIFDLNLTDYSLKLLDSAQTMGKDACHIWLSREQEIVIVSNYSSGNFSIFEFESKNETLGKRIETVDLKFEGKGPVEERQEIAHAHCGCYHEKSGCIYLADLGGDKIHIFQYSPESKKVLPFKTQTFFALSPGFGPRHLCLSLDGLFLYCLNELQPFISVFSIHSDGFLELIQTIRTIYEEPLKENSNAEVRIHPNGRFLVSSNRGYDVLSVFERDEKTGMLSFLRVQSTLGNCPRNFNFSGCGKFLVVGNQTSDSVFVFGFNVENAYLEEIAKVELKRPNRVLIKKIA